MAQAAGKFKALKDALTQTDAKCVPELGMNVDHCTSCARSIRTTDCCSSDAYGAPNTPMLKWRLFRPLNTPSGLHLWLLWHGGCLIADVDAYVHLIEVLLNDKAGTVICLHQQF